MRKIARGFQRLESSPDLILSSPYLRAQETAQIIAKACGLDKSKLVLTENFSPAGRGERLVQEINDRFAGMQKIALVGHEPSVSTLIAMLLAGDPDLSITMKKGGICKLTIETLSYARCATLDWLLFPSQLAKIGR